VISVFFVSLQKKQLKTHNTLKKLLLTITTLALSLQAIGQLPQRGLSAHRGENEVHPENTLPAIIEALRLGSQQVEFDLRMTSDGHLVLMHDATVDRTTNGTGDVSNMTFAQVRQLDAGAWKHPRFAGTKVPTFEEVLDLFPDSIWINVHTRSVAVAVAAAEIIVRRGLTHQAFIADRRNATNAVRAAFSQVMICNLERYGDDIARYVRETIEHGDDFIQLRQLASPEDMQRLRNAGVRINFSGAVHSPEHFMQLVQAGVDFPFVDDVAPYVELGIAISASSSTD